jgi:hypothetical protein
MQIPVYHHVYTSVQGYRTQYASPQLKPDIVARFEDLARRVYPRVAALPVRALFRLGEDDPRGAPCLGMCLVHAFPYQTDSSGRPRACVHTVYVPPSEVREHPFLNPLHAAEDLFMGPADALTGLSGRLPDRLDAPEFKSQYAAARAAIIQPEGLARPFLRALLSGAHTTVASGSPAMAHDVLAAVWPLLPPRSRHRLQYWWGPNRPADLGPFGRLHLVLMDAAPQAAGIDAEGCLVFDLIRRRLPANQPAEHAYAAWLMERVGVRDEAAVSALRFLERNDPLAETAYFAFNHLGQALRLIEPMLDREGILDAAVDVQAAAEALLPISRAGLSRVALSALDDIESAFEGGMSEELTAAMGDARRALQNFGPDAEYFLKAFENSLHEACGSASESAPSHEPEPALMDDEPRDNSEIQVPEDVKMTNLAIPMPDFAKLRMEQQRNDTGR